MTASPDPQKISENDWYYEEKGHMLFVHRVHDVRGQWMRTDQIQIPWRMIEASLKRVRAKKPRART